MQRFGVGVGVFCREEQRGTTAKQPNSKLKSLETKQLLIEGSAAVVNDQIKAESVTVECERGGLVHSDASDASSAG